jgi:hypothetical protein
MGLMCDWESVVGVVRLQRETENGEWTMRLWRNSSPFSILHSPFSVSLIFLPLSGKKFTQRKRVKLSPDPLTFTSQK